MQVETYETNEVTGDGAADLLDEQAVALIDKLGLTGQRSLVSKGSGDVALMPYQEMTAEELAVYELLFPIKTPIHEYNAGPIPLRVLQVAALAIEREWFGKVQVWHKRSGSAKEDPLLVGVIVDPKHTFIDRQRFLLARWGDALRPYTDLLREAAIDARARLRSCCSKAHAEIESAAAQIDHLSDGIAIRWAVSNGPQVHNESPREG